MRSYVCCVDHMNRKCIELPKHAPTLHWFHPHTLTPIELRLIRMCFFFQSDNLNIVFWDCVLLAVLVLSAASCSHAHLCFERGPLS